MKNYREIPFALVPYSQEHHHKFVCLVLTMVVMFQLRRSIVMLNGSDGKVKDVQGTVIWDGRWEVIFWRECLMDLAFIQFFFTFIICIDNYITGSFFRELQKETIQTDMFPAENARFYVGPFIPLQYFSVTLG